MAEQLDQQLVGNWEVMKVEQLDVQKGLYLEMMLDCNLVGRKVEH